MLTQLSSSPTRSAFASLRSLGGPVAFGAAMLAFSALGTAAGASECLNGYRTIGEDVIVACEAPNQAVVVPEAGLSFSETAPAEAISPSVPRVIMRSLNDCEPGSYRMMNWGDKGTMMLACR
jgi:hypothetical protein